MQLLDFLEFEQVTSANLRFLRMVGVECLQIGLPRAIDGSDDHTEDFKRLRALVEDHELQLYAIDWWRPSVSVVYGRRERDEDIASRCRLLTAIGAAGVPATAMLFTAIGTFRTTGVLGRGGALYDSWDYADYLRNPRQYPEPHFPPLDEIGHRVPQGDEVGHPLQHFLRPFPRGREIGADELWENLFYLLDRIVPAAEEAGVRIALHPEDPPIPDPLGGAARILTSPEAFDRVFDRYASDAIGMLFCQGVVAEMGVDVVETIHRIGDRDRIVYVHLRAVRGHTYSFQEVFIDEGDINMHAAMDAYRAVGFEGPVTMDHSPGIPHPAGELLGRAYANGYIRALLQRP